MKYFVVLAILALSCYAVNAGDPKLLTENQRATVIKNARECKQEHKIPKGTFKEFAKGNFENASQDVKCFFKCFLEKYGFCINDQDQSAAMSDELDSVIANSKLSAIKAKCTGLKGSDGCDTAFEFFKCGYFLERN